MQDITLIPNGDGTCRLSRSINDTNGPITYTPETGLLIGGEKVAEYAGPLSTGGYVSIYENEYRSSSRIDLGPIGGLTIPAGMLQEGDTIHIENGRVVIERKQQFWQTWWDPQWLTPNSSSTTPK